MTVPHSDGDHFEVDLNMILGLYSEDRTRTLAIIEGYSTELSAWP